MTITEDDVVPDENLAKRVKKDDKKNARLQEKDDEVEDLDSD